MKDPTLSDLAIATAVITSQHPYACPGWIYLLLACESPRRMIIDQKVPSQDVFRHLSRVSPVASALTRELRSLEKSTADPKALLHHWIAAMTRDIAALDEHIEATLRSDLRGMGQEVVVKASELLDSVIRLQEMV